MKHIIQKHLVSVWEGQKWRKQHTKRSVGTVQTVYSRYWLSAAPPVTLGSYKLLYPGWRHVGEEFGVVERQASPQKHMAWHVHVFAAEGTCAITRIYTPSESIRSNDVFIAKITFRIKSTHKKHAVGKAARDIRSLYFYLPHSNLVHHILWAPNKAVKVDVL